MCLLRVSAVVVYLQERLPNTIWDALLGNHDFDFGTFSKIYLIIQNLILVFRIPPSL